MIILFKLFSFSLLRQKRHWKKPKMASKPSVASQVSKLAHDKSFINSLNKNSSKSKPKISPIKITVSQRKPVENKKSKKRQKVIDRLRKMHQHILDVEQIFKNLKSTLESRAVQLRLLSSDLRSVMSYQHNLQTDMKAVRGSLKKSIDLMKRKKQQLKKLNDTLNKKSK